MDISKEKAIDTIIRIVSEVKKLDERRKETIKSTNELAKQIGVRVDWGSYEVKEVKHG